MPVPASFTVHRGDPASPLILHVPHSSRAIPADVRAGLAVSDPALSTELGHLTDAHTDAIAAAAARAGSGAWQFVNRLSRLVVDPERLPDDEEEMVAVGMGVVYSRTSHGALLRAPDPERDADLRARYFAPYADALADLVADRVAATGRAVILDVHSYPRVALPYELHGHLARPVVCLGTDAHHTPAGLLAAALHAFRPLGEVAVNAPFSGSYVPLRHYRTDLRVQSLMVEVRRDTYLGERDGAPSGGLDLVAAALARLLATLGHG
jgi:N-formylglutamate deformylase